MAEEALQDARREGDSSQVELRAAGRAARLSGPGGGVPDPVRLLLEGGAGADQQVEGQVPAVHPDPEGGRRLRQAAAAPAAPLPRAAHGRAHVDQDRSGPPHIHRLGQELGRGQQGQERGARGRTQPSRGKHEPYFVVKEAGGHCTPHQQDLLSEQRLRVLLECADHSY